ncbi:MAG: TonB-dependent receptor plug domain-containing protein [Candidatus Methylomirabilis oxygeniifera]|uniref:TonB-dependent receptor protein n=1 Tax=Methylomirabilis oxygeniifera TaxID=671143 RepID=D5MGY2_METO1|nr:MAG: TonB-dependent receptor plug domain-containing protein [Candidatus Methylomirabilis oxyfera]CBE69013.1 TonB-dependent receptor protein [Candidatus Methylomirabilis oxyfera]
MKQRERQRTRRRTAALVGVATLLTWGAVAHAEEEKKTDEVTTLKEVVVRSTALNDVFVPLNASVIDQTTLQSIPPATNDTATLLRDVPGVSLYGAGGISSLPVIHGLADDRLRIKVDGMDLISACPNHMTPPLSYIDPAGVGTLRVFAGIAPVSVGGDSIGGTILLESPAPVFAAPGQTPLLTGHLSSFYRSNNKARGGDYSATFATDNFSATYNGSVIHADNYTAGGNFKPAGPAAVDKPGNILDGDEVGASAFKAENHNLAFALKQGNHLFEAKFGYQYIPEQGFPNQRMDMTTNSEWRQNLHYLGQFGWGSLDIRGYHEIVNHKMDFSDDKQFLYGAPPFVAPGMPMKTDSRNIGGSVKTNIDLTKEHTLRVGGEYQYYRLHDWWPPSPKVLPPGYTYGGMAPDTFLNINDGTRTRGAVFAEWEARLHPQWLTLLGARYEHVKMTADDVHGYNSVMPSYQFAAEVFNARDHDRTDHNWDLTALTRYTPTPMLSLEFGYAHKTRSPNLYERYPWSTNSMAMIMNNFVGDGNGYVGNLDLDPEKAHTISGTVDWHATNRTWEFKVTPYYTHVTDYIDAKRCLGSGSGMNSMCGGPANNTAVNKFVLLQYVNQTARLWGVDVSTHMPLAKINGIGEFNLAGLFNYTNGKNRTTGDDLYNIMPLNGKLSLRHQLGGFDSGLEVVMAKGKNNVSDVRNEIKTSGYVLANLRAGYSWKMMRLDFGIDNVFDKYYSLPLGGAYTGQGATMGLNSIPWGTAVPGMGRSYNTRLTYRF